MKNLDNVKNMDDLRGKLFTALQSEDVKVQEEAFKEYTAGLQESIMNEAKATMNAYGETQNDESVLINRGTMKALTSTEKKYFNAVVERGGFEGVAETFPTTIIEDVFKDLKQNHPLLSKIDMRDTKALATYIFANPNQATAFWGPICEDIKQMILAGFRVVNLKSSRLSGFVAICKGMLELGPEWLARYVTTLMYEIMAVSLETAVVAGTGKDQPIGMTKQVSGAVDSVYPDKTKITMGTIDAKSMAGIRAALAKAKLDSSNVAIIVNPVTYWAKLFGALAFQAQTGAWVLDRMATGEEIIKSYAVPENTLIIGDPKNYFLGVASDVSIKRYDQTLAIEDMELFIAKFYGYGLAKDANAFFVVDVSTASGATVPALEELEENTETPGA